MAIVASIHYLKCHPGQVANLTNTIASISKLAPAVLGIITSDKTISWANKPTLPVWLQGGFTSLCFGNGHMTLNVIMSC